ncbi:MAG: TetR family transcriptional regulator [Actinomycetota bacterium]|nr:TetR family transcriptional regulator [Actinomycetota bacterium]
MSGRRAGTKDVPTGSAPPWAVVSAEGADEVTGGGLDHVALPGLRERKLARTRAQLTEAADRLFASRGFAAVTVEDICAEVDVSPRTFFRYFHSKEDVVFDGIQPCLDQTLAALADRPASEDAYEALSQALVGVVANPGVERELLRVHLIVRSSPELTGPSLEHFRALQDELMQLMAVRLPGTATHSVARLLTAVAFAAFVATLDEWSDEPAEPLAPQLGRALSAVRDGVQGIVRLGDDAGDGAARQQVTPPGSRPEGRGAGGGRSGSGGRRGRSTATPAR